MGGLLQMTEATREGKFPVVLRRDGTMVRSDVLVLLLRDPAFAAAVRAYADECERLRFDPEYVSDVRAMADQSERTIRELGAGDPAAPPWRVDDPATLAWARRRDDGDVRPIADLTAQVEGAQGQIRSLKVDLDDCRRDLDAVVASLPTCQGHDHRDMPEGDPCDRTAEFRATWGHSDWKRLVCAKGAEDFAPRELDPLPWAKAVRDAQARSGLARDLDAQARQLDAHYADEARASLAILDALDALRAAPGWLAEAPDAGRIAAHALAHPWGTVRSSGTMGLWAARDGERVVLVCLFVGRNEPWFCMPPGLHKMLVDSGTLASIAANADGWLPLTDRGAPAAGPAPLIVVPANALARVRLGVTPMDALEALADAPGWLPTEPTVPQIVAHAAAHPWDEGHADRGATGLWAVRVGGSAPIDAWIDVVLLGTRGTIANPNEVAIYHLMHPLLRGLTLSGDLADVAGRVFGWLPLDHRSAPLGRAAASDAPAFYPTPPALGRAMVEASSAAVEPSAAWSLPATRGELLAELEALRPRLERAERACFEGLPREELPCPQCGQLHVDGADGSQYGRTPHHTHQCHGCGHQWDVGRWSYGARSAPTAEGVRRG